MRFDFVYLNANKTTKIEDNIKNFDNKTACKYTR